MNASELKNFIVEQCVEQEIPADIPTILDFAYDWSSSAEKTISLHSDLAKRDATDDERETLSLLHKSRHSAFVLLWKLLDMRERIKCDNTQRSDHATVRRRSFFMPQDRRREAPVFRTDWFSGNDTIIRNVAGIIIDGAWDSQSMAGSLERRVLFSSGNFVHAAGATSRANAIMEILLKMARSLDKSVEASEGVKCRSYRDIMSRYLYQLYLAVDLDKGLTQPEGYDEIPECLKAFWIDDRRMNKLFETWQRRHVYIFDTLSMNFKMIGYANGLGICRITPDERKAMIEDPQSNCVRRLDAQSGIHNGIGLDLEIFPYDRLQYRTKPFGFRAWGCLLRHGSGVEAPTAMRYPMAGDPFDSQRLYQKYVIRTDEKTWAVGDEFTDAAE